MGIARESNRWFVPADLHGVFGAMLDKLTVGAFICGDRDAGATAVCRLFLALGLSILCSGCTGFDLLNIPVSSNGYVRTIDIPYGPIPRQKLDVYKPAPASAKAPVVIFLYGGEWVHGEKGNYRFAAEALTCKGFVAVLPDYRLYPQATFPTFVEDAARAVRWTHDNIACCGGDPDRIYLMGHSAGAHIAALLTLDAHYLKDAGVARNVIRATAVLSGPFDFNPSGEDRAVFSMAPDAKSPPRAMEPVNFADGTAPPMLIIQGGRDKLVNPANATELESKICRRGGTAKLIIYPDRGHESVVIALAAPWRWLAPVLDDTANFFRQH